MPLTILHYIADDENDKKTIFITFVKNKSRVP